MFRIPSLAEIVGLFVKSRTVAGATKAISDTVRRLEDVAKHHDAQADRKHLQADALRYRATGLIDDAKYHGSEATKAAAVAKNLSALLS